MCSSEEVRAIAQLQNTAHPHPVGLAGWDSPKFGLVLLQIRSSATVDDSEERPVLVLSKPKPVSMHRKRHCEVGCGIHGKHKTWKLCPCRGGPARNRE